MSRVSPASSAGACGAVAVTTSRSPPPIAAYSKTVNRLSEFRRLDGIPISTSTHTADDGGNRQHAEVQCHNQILTTANSGRNHRIPGRYDVAHREPLAADF